MKSVRAREVGASGSVIDHHDQTDTSLSDPQIVLHIAVNLGIRSTIHRYTRATRVNDLIRVITLYATVVTSCSLTYLVGCGVAPHDSYQVGYL